MTRENGLEYKIPSRVLDDSMLTTGGFSLTLYATGLYTEVIWLIYFQLFFAGIHFICLLWLMVRKDLELFKSALSWGMPILVSLTAGTTIL